MPSTAAKNEGFWGSLATAGDWLNTRIKNIDIFDEHFQDQARENPFYALGPIFYLVWFAVMGTGLVLIMWYVPSKAAAYDSILTIQNAIPFGNIVRGVHKYGADAMIIAATMRMFRMFINADYKPSREFNIAIALVTLLLSMYSGLTGYLLIWNQRAFWATKVFATFPTYMDQFPVMGDYYMPLVKSLHLGWNTAEVLLGAGGAITQETITRFFSLHLAFSLIPLILVEIYFYRHNFTRIPLNWVKRSVVMLMLVVVALILPAALGRRSDADVTPLPILSDWYFLGLYQMYKYLEPVVATEITMVIPLTVVLLPFLDSWITGPEKNIMKRPFILMTTFMGFVSWIVFSILIIVNIANIHEDPPWWRAFLYLTVDIGLLWQMVLIWGSKDAKEWAKGVRPALIMASVGAIQTFLSICYWFMAKTEIFFSPLSQGATYLMVRWSIPQADALDAATRKLVSNDPEMPYGSNFIPAVQGWVSKIPGGDQAIAQIEQIRGQSSATDFIFQLIPTFDPQNPVYKGTVDFMVQNKWVYDYVTLMDRLNGTKQGYPMPVPAVDWWWMIGGVAVLVGGIVTFVKAKSASQQPVADKGAK